MLEFPDNIRISKATWSLASNSWSSAKSVFDNSAQTIKMDEGDHWISDVSININKITEKEQWKDIFSFIAELEGINAAFLFSPVGTVYPSQSFVSSPTILSVANDGSTITSEGWDITDSTMEVGSYIGFTSSLGIEKVCIINKPFDVNADGTATMDVRPFISTSSVPILSSNLEINKPKARFKIKNSNSIKQVFNGPNVVSFKMSFYEHLKSS